jgi:hypothetical protein
MGTRVLLLCGVISPLIYLGATIVGGAMRPGYNHMVDTVSELMSPGSPNKPLMHALFTASAVCGTLFGVGVWQFVRASGRSTTSAAIAAALLIIVGLVNILTAAVFPQDPIGAPATFPGKMHIILVGALSVMSMSATLLLGLWSRQVDVPAGYGAYTLASLSVMLLTGLIAVATGGSRWMGLTERLTVGAVLQWNLITAWRLFSVLP